jgi:hypothetical protein
MKTEKIVQKEVVSHPTIRKTLQDLPEDLHNRIMVQWEKDFGSIHSDQKMDAYTVSGFIRNLYNAKSLNVKDGDKVKEEQEEMWRDVDNNYIRWNDQEIKLQELIRDFELRRRK